MAEKEKMCCDASEIHEDLLKIVNDTIPEETELYDLAELFKVFGDSTRIRILFVLFEAEVCVCDLAVQSFFLISGFLLGIRLKEPFSAPENQAVLGRYLKKTLKMYLVWMLLSSFLIRFYDKCSFLLFPFVSLPCRLR